MSNEDRGFLCAIDALALGSTAKWVCTVGAIVGGAIVAPACHHIKIIIRRDVRIFLVIYFLIRLINVCAVQHCYLPHCPDGNFNSWC